MRETKIILPLPSHPKQATKKLIKDLENIIFKKGKNELILLYNEDENWRKKHKNELALLKKLRTNYNIHLYCSCKPSKRINLTVVKRGNLYHLRTYPRQVSLHKSGCIFSNGSNILSWEEIKKNIKPSIFYKPRHSSTRYKEKKYLKEKHIKTFKRKSITFTQLILSLIDKVYARNFNKINKEKDRLKEQDLLVLPKVYDIIKSLKIELNNLLKKNR